jgi:hypothetical protein
MADTTTKPTQAQRILARLKTEGELTNVQLVDMRILRGAARIQELRRAGHKIISIHEKGGLWRFRYEPGATAVQQRSLTHEFAVPAMAAQLGLDLGDVAPAQRRITL